MATRIRNGRAFEVDTRQKKAIKADNAKKRATWGINPVTRVVPNRKAYDRNARKAADRRLSS